MEPYLLSIVLEEMTVEPLILKITRSSLGEGLVGGILEEGAGAKECKQGRVQCKHKQVCVTV